MKKYVRMLRVKHWLKNVLIFAPLFFGGALFDYNMILKSVYAFFTFGLAASAVYIINDINDVEKDRKHPTKCRRPIASGEVPINEAKVFCIIMFLLVVVMSLVAVFTNIYSCVAVIWLVAYIVINLLYSKWGKNVPVVDVVLLAAGFLIRLYYGAQVVEINISAWLYLTVLAGAFYLGMGKRRNELKNTSDGETRAVLKKYNYDFLDKNMYVCIAFAELTYALWAMQSGHSGLMYTVPVVMIIFMKYSLNIEADESEGNPMDVLLEDKLLLVCVLLYGIIAFLSIYVL